jgi:hypothetical protein
LGVDYHTSFESPRRQMWSLSSIHQSCRRPACCGPTSSCHWSARNGCFQRLQAVRYCQLCRLALGP